MRIIIPALCGALALAGCQTIDDNIQKSLPITCALITSGHTVFLTVKANHALPANIVKDELLAFKASEQICADPTKVTTANALVIVANVWAVISEALKEAEKVE